MSIIALIPARRGSKGCPGKNTRYLGGYTLIEHAVRCALEAGCKAVVSTDITHLPTKKPEWWASLKNVSWLDRPAELAQDSTPMLDVVTHALEQIPGQPDDLICLLQPTQPFRTPARVREAIQALTPDWDSVVTITPLPRSHAPEFVLGYCNTTLSTFPMQGTWAGRPTRRQDALWPYLPDGTAYVFRRKTVEAFGNIYGELVRGIILEPHET
jgi:CMP-N,N'-diacetyllegionaminic acid synthase